ncbi:hypothetical protein [Rufibacter roseus]|uniref:Uncharacterized protein n=1 Tax=Rufibacter roseus TaxID=1567108 RepID=A0ABW2DNR4_9BACT|nr:hypothetical protein [Rufibacter roseus]
MKKASYLLISASLLFVFGCSESKTTSTENSAPVTPAAATVPGQPTATQPAPSTALNPPHGEPGHRCEIPVGAPLNSQPSTNSQLPPAPALAAPVFTPPPAQGATAAGTNPPHGQPGHDCSIPVGAPLSK